MASLLLPRAQTCRHCRGPIRFERGRGYVHANGGGSYEMSCPGCGWVGTPYPSPTRCPSCGSTEVRDDHIAEPDHSRQDWGS